MADDKKGKVTDLEALCAFWNVDQEEAIRNSAHLVRELLDLDQAGGEVVLKGQWERGLWGLGFMKKRRVERIRFQPRKKNVGG